MFRGITSECSKGKKASINMPSPDKSIRLVQYNQNITVHDPTTDLPLVKDFKLCVVSYYI